ncbi:ATP-binding protein [Halomonas sp. DWK9]|uniref:ATP-binding protein n=1 Tax=Halomonadaceae TaxID=28256 RepID=UPI00287FB231|nr:ATP-binding protein [Halomonas sp. DWK9]
MQAADLPDNEPQRLTALHALRILDTPIDEAFERLTKLACNLFDVPTALVSLVDKERQWFKSHSGLDACETSREVSFCAHAVASNMPLVIEDTGNDPRFADNPLVKGMPHIRFYAGHPLRPTDELAVGTLCLISDQPRAFSARDMSILESLASQVDELLRQHQMRYTLSQTTRRYEALFNESATGIVRIDRKGKVLSVNPFALTMLGYTKQEVVGQNVGMLTPPSIRAEHDHFIARFLAGNDPKVIGRGREVDALHKDGHLVPVHLAVNAIHNEQNEVVEFLGILTNLSDVYDANHRMHKEQSLLKVLHQGITDYQALMSGEQLWTFLMEALRELTDSDYALIGEVLPTETTNALKIHAITDLSWSDDSRHLMEMLRSGDMTLTNPDSLLGRVFAYGDVVITDDVYQHAKRGGFPSGHPRIDNYLGAPIFSGDKLIGMFAIANSKQPLSQALLDWLQPFTDTCALLINLYRQMAEREQVTQDLATARDQAEKANKAKSEFLSSMSHELRTPLNAIIGFAQLLGKGRRDPLNDKQQRQVGQIEKSGKHLLSLINEVLDLAKIESGHMTMSIEPISIERVLEDACSTLEANMDAAGIQLHRAFSEGEWVVNADYTRTKQVLLNLLSNGIKYNRQHGAITIDITPLESALRVSITDTGKGIDNERLEELFEPFNRLDAENGSIEGTGIGLAITRELIEKMGGRIGVTSQLHQGSTFWFTLPLADTPTLMPQPVAHTVTTNATSQRQYQLLYIEDNPTNQRLMEDIVEDFEHVKLQTVTSAELGLEVMRYSRPDLVLMDIHLPGMNGYQALDVIQNDPALQSLTVIALSANAMERDIAHGLAAGFTDYLTKPIDIEQLTRTLNHYFYPLSANDAPRTAP